MERTRIAELWNNPEVFSDKDVTLGGWVRTIRDMKNFHSFAAQIDAKKV